MIIIAPLTHGEFLIVWTISPVPILASRSSTVWFLVLISYTSPVFMVSSPIYAPIPILPMIHESLAPQHVLLSSHHHPNCCLTSFEPMHNPTEFRFLFHYSNPLVYCICFFHFQKKILSGGPPLCMTSIRGCDEIMLLIICVVNQRLFLAVVWYGLFIFESNHWLASGFVTLQKVSWSSTWVRLSSQDICFDLPRTNTGYSLPLGLIKAFQNPPFLLLQEYHLKLRSYFLWLQPCQSYNFARVPQILTHFEH